MAGEPHQGPGSMAQREEEDTPARRPLSLECPPRYQDYLHIAAFESGGSNFSYGEIYPVEAKIHICRVNQQGKRFGFVLIFCLCILNEVGV